MAAKKFLLAAAVVAIAIGAGFSQGFGAEDGGLQMGVYALSGSNLRMELSFGRATLREDFETVAMGTYKTQNGRLVVSFFAATDAAKDLKGTVLAFQITDETSFSRRGQLWVLTRNALPPLPPSNQNPQNSGGQVLKSGPYALSGNNLTLDLNFGLATLKEAHSILAMGRYKIQDGRIIITFFCGYGKGENLNGTTQTYFINDETSFRAGREFWVYIGY